MEEKIYYSVEDIMGMFNKTRTTVLAWANDNSLEGFKAEKKGKTWFFRKIDGEAKAEEASNPKDKEEIQRLEGRVGELEDSLSDERQEHQNKVAELQTKHINELTEEKGKNDKIRRNLEDERTKFENWAKTERENIEKERGERLGGVEAQENAIEERDNKLNEKEAKILELKLKVEGQEKSNEETRGQLGEELALVEEERERLAKIIPEAEKEARENIERILTHLKKGAIGFIEQALYQLTSPFVERSYVSYKCPDCHKDGSDKINRKATFDIPLLRDCPPSYAFGVCPDCDPDQRNNRNLPTFLCEVCPTEERMLTAGDFLKEALTMVGIQVEYDSDGQYKPTRYVSEKDRRLSVKEQVDILTDKFRPFMEASKVKEAEGGEAEGEEPVEVVEGEVVETESEGKNPPISGNEEE